LTVLYLDEEVVTTAARIGSALAEGWQSSATVPMLAAPFESIVPWEWDRALPH
jgi:hypothetical protein